MANRTCSIDGCEKRRRSPGAEWCAMHYHRWYRHGDPLITAKSMGVKVSLGRRYTAQYSKGHPLAGKNGRVYTHRMVLFDAIGYGPHSCHWCGAEVDWAPRGTPGELHVDHLNGDGADNRIANLAPSCRTCNVARAMQSKSDALREAGLWSNNDTVALTGGGRKKRIAPRVRPDFHEEVA